MNGLDSYYDGLLAEHQRMIDKQAQEEEEAEREAEYDSTPEDRAFIDSYARCVAVGTREDVMHFLRPTNKYVMPDYIFESIENAWLVWNDAIQFMKGEKK
jgi:hypothetical protein